MKWTPEKIAELRELAGQRVGGSAIADHFGVTPVAVHSVAFDNGITISRYIMDEDDRTRARWRKLLPAMKVALRAEIEAM